MVAAHVYEPPLPAAVVGHKFVRAYYSVLADNPTKLHKFYKEHSVFSRWDEQGFGKDVISAVGPGDIHSEIMAAVGHHTKRACKAKISEVACQESRQGSVLILITGYLTWSSCASDGPRRFTQTFLLEKQSDPDGYYVLNDILRYTKEMASQSQVSQHQQQHHQQQQQRPQHQQHEQLHSTWDPVPKSPVQEQLQQPPHEQEPDELEHATDDAEEFAEEDDSIQQQGQGAQEESVAHEEALSHDVAEEPEKEENSDAVETPQRTWASLAANLNANTTTAKLGPSKAKGGGKSAGEGALNPSRHLATTTPSTCVLPPPGSTGAGAAASADAAKGRRKGGKGGKNDRGDKSRGGRDREKGKGS